MIEWNSRSVSLLVGIQPLAKGWFPWMIGNEDSSNGCQVARSTLRSDQPLADE